MRTCPEDQPLNPFWDASAACSAVSCFHPLPLSVLALPSRRSLCFGRNTPNCFVSSQSNAFSFFCTSLATESTVRGSSLSLVRQRLAISDHVQHSWKPLQTISDHDSALITVTMVYRDSLLSTIGPLLATNHCLPFYTIKSAFLTIISHDESLTIYHCSPVIAIVKHCFWPLHL